MIHLSIPFLKTWSKKCNCLKLHLILNNIYIYNLPHVFSNLMHHFFFLITAHSMLGTVPKVKCDIRVEAQSSNLTTPWKTFSTLSEDNHERSKLQRAATKTKWTGPHLAMPSDMTWKYVCEVDPICKNYTLPATIRYPSHQTGSSENHRLQSPLQGRGYVSSQKGIYRYMIYAILQWQYITSATPKCITLHVLKGKTSTKEHSQAHRDVPLSEQTIANIWPKLMIQITKITGKEGPLQTLVSR